MTDASIAPAVADGDITDFQTKLRRTFEQSGTHLEYIEWVQQNYLSAPSSIIGVWQGFVPTAAI